jgi:hypothetical protein
MWFSLTAGRKLSQSGDMPRSTIVAASGLAQKRQLAMAA